ncbi:hypothetical protein Droror1_Dr00021319 [Drosera rotundifolia]
MFVGHQNLQALMLPNSDLIFSTNTHNTSCYPQLVLLDLAKCNLIRFPSILHNQTRLIVLELGYNKIKGSLPIPPPATVVYDMRTNGVTGKIPKAICNATSLKFLHLGDNRNAGLCDSPLSKKCGSPEVQAASPNKASSEEDEDSTDVIGWVIRSMGYISELVVGAIIGRVITVKNHDWFVETFGRKQHKKKKKKQRHIS